MKANDFVIAHLIEPKEQVWGKLIELKQAGIVIRGIDLKQTDTFKYQFRGEDRKVYPQTLFVPMRRVVQIALDESLDDLPSIIASICDYTELSPDELLR
ncbi:hypothetical protein [Acanthopleuribacter pedis]|uniref:Uncharacterized protein n=1 Tax=Acanthopleuribacter pedis TaxID=442870 RepID=A0A8J7U301_9BACT|nr:hypothetical protein [Acanthopleuribacter pedis]MBO1319112.1 hypothetical protein [Acanthopleuribacter pedis]